MTIPKRPYGSGPLSINEKSKYPLKESFANEKPLSIPITPVKMKITMAPDNKI